jgi:hypothetical protein
MGIIMLGGVTGIVHLSGRRETYQNNDMYGVKRLNLYNNMYSKKYKKSIL